MSFRRINFFRGLFMTAEDWRIEQNYHIEKRQLHTRAFQTPGVVTGDDLKGSLEVNVIDTGAIVIQPGYAVDGLGRDLRLFEAKELPAPSGNGEAEKEMFVYIAFEEEKAEPRESRLHPEYRDNAFIMERAKVGWTDQPPDNHERLELARVKWRPGRRITRDQLDTSRVKYAGARHARSHMVRVQAGETELNPNPTGAGLVFAADDVKVLIQAFSNQEEAAEAVYVANVYPDLDQDAGDARVFWRIESSIIKRQQIAYYLLLKNFGTQRVKVHYAVYRLLVKNVA